MSGLYLNRRFFIGWLGAIFALVAAYIYPALLPWVTWLIGAYCVLILVDAVLLFGFGKKLEARRSVTDKFSNGEDNPVRIEVDNRYPFEVQSLPSASFNLIQQVGRLIRSHGCWGEVVIYDKRLLTKNYGKRLLDALPVFPIEQPEVPEGIVKKKEKTKSPRRRRR